MKIPELSARGSAKAVSTKLLRSVWNKISDKPFPDVYAFIFDDNDFFLLLNRLQESPSVTDTRVKEYGVNFDNKYIEACSFKVKSYFVILVKQSAPLSSPLEYELKHIAEEVFTSTE